MQEEGIKYQAYTLIITLYKDYLLWEATSLKGIEKFTLFYKDMISVSYSNGWGLGEAFIEINTAGKVYRYSPDIAGKYDMETVAKAIQERIDSEAEKKAIVSNIHINPNTVEPTITRIELFIEDDDWDTAKAYCDAALDYFPTEGRIYLYSMFVDYKIKNIQELKNIEGDFTQNSNYKNIQRFATDEVKAPIETIVKEKEEKRNLFGESIKKMQSGDYSTALEMLNQLEDNLVVSSLKEECIGKIREEEEKKKELEYEKRLKERKDTHLMEIIDEWCETVASNSNSHDSSKIIQLEKEIFNYIGIKEKKRNVYCFENFKNKQLTNEWQVIGRKDHYLLLLNNGFASADPFIVKRGSTDWHRSDEWRVCVDYLDYFSNVHKQLFVAPCQVYGDHNSPNCEIYMLSKDEIEKYLCDHNQRVLYDNHRRSYVRWLIRDDIGTDIVGYIDVDGNNCAIKLVPIIHPWFAAYIRPAVWIDMNVLGK